MAYSETIEYVQSDPVITIGLTQTNPVTTKSLTQTNPIVTKSFTLTDPSLTLSFIQSDIALTKNCATEFNLLGDFTFDNTFIRFDNTGETFDSL